MDNDRIDPMTPETYADLAMDIARTRPGLGFAPIEYLREWVAGAVKGAREDLARHGMAPACKGLGCNGCCRGEILLSDTEWRRIEPLLTREIRSRVLADESALTHNVREAHCPLVDPDTGGCSIYDERPISCRAFESYADHADLCWPERSGYQQIPLHPLLGAAVVAAMYAVRERGRLVSTLAQALLAWARDGG